MALIWRLWKKTNKQTNKKNKKTHLFPWVIGRIYFLADVGLRLPFSGWQSAGSLFWLLDNTQLPHHLTPLIFKKPTKVHQILLVLRIRFSLAFPF